MTPEGFGDFNRSITPSEISGQPPRTRERHHDYTINFSFCDGSAQNLRFGQRSDLVFTNTTKASARGWH